MRVIPHGVDDAFFQLDGATYEPYVLCVSTLHPHKNIDRLIRAYTRRKREYKLILAGMRGFHTDAVEKLLTDDIPCSSPAGSREKSF